MLNGSSSSSPVKDALASILADIGSQNNDVAQYRPNPFYLFNNETTISKTEDLFLVDGGEDLQNVPLNPLIQPVRGVDVIFAVDSSA
jgi:lysophospholipase